MRHKAASASQRCGRQLAKTRPKLSRKMVFVSDLYTNFARIAGNTDDIPRDRVVDGVDQTPILLKGDTHGRRDYVHLYEVDNLKATVKQNMKIHWPGPGVNPAMAGIYNLYWDPREDNPLKYQGVWAGTPFVRMRVQHLRLKDKFADWQPARGVPYEDVENLRPETKEMVETWNATYGDAKDVILGVESQGNGPQVCGGPNRKAAKRYSAGELK